MYVSFVAIVKSVLSDDNREKTSHPLRSFSAVLQAGVCVRFFKRKTHPEAFLSGKFSYTVLGLGDSNLLLDRQTTTAKDCNRCAQELDARLEALGAKRQYTMGIADERAGLEEVETWVEGLWAMLEG
jgi:sulfite reductase alpha subunit-like flavoprotein